MGDFIKLNDEMNKTNTATLCLLGSSNVGKTSIIKQASKNIFKRKVNTTIGAAYTTYYVKINNDVTVRFNVWDLAGQDRYKSLSSMYYKIAHAIMVVYDITDKNTYEIAKTWIYDLKAEMDNNIVIALIGNKLDLNAKREITYQESKLFADNMDILFFETSAKTSENILITFKTIAQNLKNSQLDTIVEELEEQSSCCIIL